MSDIQNFYKNKNVLLTGGTGFLGTMIVHQLLKTTEVNKIYLIIRPKKEILAEERKNQIFDNPVFSAARPKIHKIKAVQGDLSKINLGLDKEDIGMLSKKVHIVIHCGASLNMGSNNIRDTVLCNVEATKYVVDLAKSFTYLQSLVYVSTAYSNCNSENLVIEERFYKTPIQDQLLIKMAKEMDDETLEHVANVLKGDWPNFYTYTKAVSESIIKDACNDIPAGIVRPSIVISSVKEPAEGWIDNLYGPLGLILNIYLGVLRATCTKSSSKQDLVPADHAVNAILCAAWEIHSRWQSPPYRPLILNCSGKDSNILVDQYTFINSSRVALNSAIWYPTILLIHNPILFMLIDFIYHKVPYYIMDQIAVLSGKKPLASRLFEKISKVRGILYFFMVREFVIQNDNMYKLWNKLGPEDQKMYDFNVSAIKRDEYFKSLGMGLKRFVVKEDFSKVNTNKKHRWLKISHYTTTGIVIAIFALLIRFLVSFANGIL